MSNTLSPEKTELKRFGFVLGLGLVCIFDIFIPFVFNRDFPIWPLWAALVLAMAAIVWPTGLLPLYRVWMKLGEMLHWINTRIILGLIFFILFMPVSLIWRLVGIDPLGRKFSSTNSYRTNSAPRDAKDMENPF